MEPSDGKMSDSPAAVAARIRSNQEQLAANLDEQFDFIVCGAGTSGQVVQNVAFTNYCSIRWHHSRPDRSTGLEPRFLFGAVVCL
jgi:hypothetical protein